LYWQWKQQLPAKCIAGRLCGIHVHRTDFRHNNKAIGTTGHFRKTEETTKIISKLMACTNVAIFDENRICGGRHHGARYALKGYGDEMPYGRSICAIAP
jgi:hypothetical protein